MLPGNGRFFFLHDSSINCPFYVDNTPIDCVDSCVHLGHVITNQLIDTADNLQRRNDFVGQANTTLCFFNKLNSNLRCKLF